jgi:hypothetical protein
VLSAYLDVIELKLQEVINQIESLIDAIAFSLVNFTIDLILSGDSLYCTTPIL